MNKSNYSTKQDKFHNHGVDFYLKQFEDEAKEKRGAKTQINTAEAKKNIRNGVLLLSNYRPKEFGNTSITLTVDGGQHLRSPGDEAPKITQKNVE
jgi:hypothetical protein